MYFSCCDSYGLILSSFIIRIFLIQAIEIARNFFGHSCNAIISHFDYLVGYHYKSHKKTFKQNYFAKQSESWVISWFLICAFANVFYAGSKDYFRLSGYAHVISLCLYLLDCNKTHFILLEQLQY